MTDTLRDLLKQQDATKFATESGLRAHRNMQMIVIDGDVARGDPDVIAKIKSRPELLPFFVATAQTEVPVAGIIRGRFISRRIDRMVADHDKHQIIVMDYKTDVSPDKFHDKYCAQIREYMELLCEIYPGYVVNAYILWLHDFRLESVQ